MAGQKPALQMGIFVLLHPTCQSQPERRHRFRPLRRFAHRQAASRADRAGDRGCARQAATGAGSVPHPPLVRWPHTIRKVLPTSPEWPARPSGLRASGRAPALRWLPNSASISISPQAFSETLATFCSHSVTKARSRGCGFANDSKGAGMPTIALVDDDRNILTSVSMTLGDGRLPGADLQRRNPSAGRAGTESARSRDFRYQDAPDGRDGAAQKAPPELRLAGDLPHLQGRRDRRIVRPENGRGRFHQKSRSRNASWWSASGPCCGAPSRATGARPASASRAASSNAVR